MGNDTVVPKTDEEFVSEALANPESIKFLIERYEAKLGRYIQRTLYVNNEDTEDILQEVFIKVYRYLNSFNPKYKFSSWIYRITYNECISYYREHKKFKLNVDLDLEKKVFQEIASDINLEEQIMKDEQKEMVAETLEKLDEKYKAVLVLKYIEERDYTEISDILKLPIGTVGSLISRAKSIFRNLINHDESNK
jgi:RNA polymerase sigma-70 factor (ECF subfamily)